MCVCVCVCVCVCGDIPGLFLIAYHVMSSSLYQYIKQNYQNNKQNCVELSNKILTRNPT